MDYSDEAITHVSEIVRTVEFELASGRTFRLDILKVEKGTAHVHFDVDYYERQTLYKASDGTITSESIAGAPQFYVWVPDVSLPWVSQPSADAALEQALRWLAERPVTMVSSRSHAALTISASRASCGKPISAMVLVRFGGKCEAAFETSRSSKNPYDDKPSFRFSRTGLTPAR